MPDFEDLSSLPPLRELAAALGCNPHELQAGIERMVAATLAEMSEPVLHDGARR